MLQINSFPIFSFSPWSILSRIVFKLSIETEKERSELKVWQKRSSFKFYECGSKRITFSNNLDLNNFAVLWSWSYFWGNFQLIEEFLEKLSWKTFCLNFFWSSTYFAPTQFFRYLKGIEIYEPWVTFFLENTEILKKETFFVFIYFWGNFKVW